MVETFADDDVGYEAWLRAHPGGVVVNCERNPRASYVMLHRASCHTISGTPPSGRSWTTQYLKVCADAAGELEAWARVATGGALGGEDHQGGREAQKRESPVQDGDAAGWGQRHTGPKAIFCSGVPPSTALSTASRLSSPTRNSIGSCRSSSMRVERPG